MNGIGPETRQVLESLRRKSENDSPQEGWRDVYLDNAVPAGMKATAFRSYLAKLSQHGLYRPIDNYAFGSVKMKDE